MHTFMKLKNLFKKKEDPNALKQVRVGHYTLWANGEHPIEQLLNVYKHYSRNLARLAKYIEHKYPNYNLIDVGANIGDTAALVRSEGVNQHIHSFEGEPTYFKLLQTNLQQFSNVSAYEAFLGQTNETQTISTEVSLGTAKLSQQSDRQIVVQKLSDLANKHQITNIKLLKTDTDGFDFKILRGSLDLISRDKPVLFFEYDATYLEEQGEDGTAIFKQLQDLGYHKMMYYDNFGKFLICITTKDTALIQQLYNYMRKQEGAFPYYDVTVFHKDDDELADHVVAQETEFFK
jgi:FkbM family methyltransferase